MNKILFSSEKNNWETPQDLFDEYNNIYKFTVDVASDDHNYKVKKHYTEKENGLIQNWENERVWCNPPYGREINKWVYKAHCSRCLTVMLLPARTDTVWFHEWIYNKSNVKIQFLRGRLKFGNSKNNAPFPSMIVIFNKF